MNEFEWRRQLRKLRQPLTPERDLWDSIDAALDQGARGDSSRAADSAAQAPRPRRHRWLLATSAAAALVLAGGLGWKVLQAPDAISTASSEPQQRWNPSDPRLSGAAIELDAARMELELALQQAPDSLALQRLLERTELQQSQLRQRTRRAG